MSPAVTEGLCLVFGFKGSLLSSLSERTMNVKTCGNTFLQFCCYSEAENQTRLALLNSPASSGERSGLKVAWTAQAPVKRLPVSQVHHPLHLTSLSENILPEWPERIFTSLCLKKGGKWPFYSVQDYCYEQRTTEAIFLRTLKDFKKTVYDWSVFRCFHC